MLIHQITNSTGNYTYNAVIYDNCEWYYHFHKSFELLFVLEGSILAGIDSHTEVLSAGDFALVLPNQLHSYHTPEYSRVWIGVFSGDFVSRFAAQISKKVGENARFACDNAVRQFVLHYLIEQDTRDIYLLKACFYGICDQYQKNVSLTVRDFENDNLLCKIVDYVSSNFRSDLTLRKAAHDLGFEYHYLSRRFHAIFNMNFSQFVNQYRINLANELLSVKRGSISDIAFESGFQSVRSFNNVYRKFCGCSPSQNK